MDNHNRPDESSQRNDDVVDPSTQSLSKRTRETLLTGTMTINEEKFLEGFAKAIKSIKDKRYFSTERGYQGQLITELANRISIKTIFDNNNVILEQEYQKTLKSHGISFRPDIILHVPYESGLYSNRQSGNYAVIQLKLRASPTKAREDFRKLDSMFAKLDYPLGIFLNINSDKTFCDSYSGRHSQRLHCFAVKLADNEVIVKHEKPSTSSR